MQKKLVANKGEIAICIAGAAAELNIRAVANTCYVDRVNILVATIAMAEQYNWDCRTFGTVLSPYDVGYLLMQVIGEFLADCFGEKSSFVWRYCFVRFLYRYSPGRIIWNAWIANRSRFYGLG